MAPAPATPSVLVVDHQDDAEVDVTRWATFVGAVLRDLGVPATVDVAVTFVDRDAIAALHREHLGLDGPTDVLSFPVDGEGAAGALLAAADAGPSADSRLAVLDGDPSLPGGDRPWLLGDVVVCPSVAATQASAHAGGLDDELALLVVHGLLHLLGLDHTAPDERALMQFWERQLLDRHHGPIGGDP
jgi:probable rRNA maturation factor